MAIRGVRERRSREKGQWSDYQCERKEERNYCREGMRIKNGIEIDRYIKKVQNTATSNTHMSSWAFDPRI